MALPRHIYEEFERVVGSENISDKPYVLAGVRAAMAGGPKPPSPEAVMLPGSTEEVRQIIKICNKHKIPYIATVSSLIGFAYPSGPGTVILQLKRMNQIEEINVEDRYAVIQPGVRHGQLFTELMKVGLTYPVAAVGPGGSVLANFACSSGDNHCQHGQSRTNRYLAGIEWVEPTGEIVRIGSLANDGGWFCADGPGPSLRGLIRGYIGQAGGMGIVTRIAISLNAWRGPRAFPTEGRSPSYTMRLDKKYHKVLIFKFPSLDRVRDAMLEIGKAEIAQAVLKYFYATAALLATESANDFWELWNSGLFQKELSMPLYVFLSTWTPEEMECEERVLNDIIAETGGEPVDERILRIYEENMDFFMLVGFLQRVPRLGGGWAPCKLSADSISHMFDVAKAIPEFMTEFIEQGKILNAPHNFQIIPLEYGHSAHIELLFLWDRTRPDALRIPMAFMKASQEADIKNGHHATMPPRIPAAAQALGALYSNSQTWVEKIKEAFDPQRVSNPR